MWHLHCGGDFVNLLAIFLIYFRGIMQIQYGNLRIVSNSYDINFYIRI